MIKNNKINDLYQSYWDDYVNNRPIAGGVSYEMALKDCRLDESLHSLQRLDILLSKIRKDITNNKDIVINADNNDRVVSAQVKQAHYLSSQNFKKLVVFVGFYAVRVLAKVYKSQPEWYVKDDLKLIDENLARQGFEYSVAGSFVNEDSRKYLTKTDIAPIHSPWLFFVFEIITRRLFANVTYKVIPIQSAHLDSKNTVNNSDSLYQSAIERIPRSVVIKLIEKEQTKQPNINTNTVSVKTAVGMAKNLTLHNLVDDTIQNQNTTFVEPSHIVSDKVIHNTIAQNAVEFSKVKVSEATISHESPTLISNQTIPETDIVQAPTHLNLHKKDTKVEDVSQNPISANKNKAETKIDDYLEAVQDLKNLAVNQHVTDDKYKQVQDMLFQFDDKADEQTLDLDKTRLYATKSAQLRSALSVLQECVQAGNNSAMLHIAIYQLQGRWLQKNQELAFTHIQTASNNQDMRAMKLLSKLYYRGEGVKQDVTLGKYWLEQAADKGHQEAMKICQQMQMAQVLMQNNQDDKKSDKNYMYVIGGISLFTLVLFIFV